MSRSLLMEMGTGRADPDFEEILGKAAVGGELSVEEGGRLLEAEGYELLRLVAVADELRRKTVGDVVTYVVNRNLNFSNVCLSDCKFCAFKRPPGAPGAYMLTREQIATRVREAVTSGATEVCVQGGLHPEFGLENYLEILRTIREVSPDIHIHAFSPAELDHISKIEHMGVGEVIKALREAGLDSVPGTAAEILVDRVRSIICPKKISSARWVEVIEVCHRLGVPTTATMLYGTIETPYERAEHLVLLREVQHRTGGFTEFVPLAFMPYNTPLWGDGERSPPSLADSLRVHAVARLMLAGNIDNIQASWVKLGPRGAQLMLRAGANDLGGTLMEENITRAAGGKNHSMTVQRLKQLISELGRVPKQRMTTYELL